MFAPYKKQSDFRDFVVLTQKKTNLCWSFCYSSQFAREPFPYGKRNGFFVDLSQDLTGVTILRS